MVKIFTFTSPACGRGHTPQNDAEFFDVARKFLTREKDRQTPITESPSLTSQRPESLAQHRVQWAREAVTHQRPRNAQRTARPPLADTMRLTKIRHRVTLRGWRYHFFALTSFSMALSSIVSASSFFSRAFSASSARNRCTSETS